MPDVTLLQPKHFSSDLDEIAREGARRMLAEALEAEVADCMASEATLLICCERCWPPGRRLAAYRLVGRRAYARSARKHR